MAKQEHHFVDSTDSLFCFVARTAHCKPRGDGIMHAFPFGRKVSCDSTINCSCTIYCHCGHRSAYMYDLL